MVDNPSIAAMLDHLTDENYNKNKRNEQTEDGHGIIFERNAPPKKAKTESFYNTSQNRPGQDKEESILEDWAEVKRTLGKNFIPGPNDVICARGNLAWNHEGNKRFRALGKLYAERYSSLTSKIERTSLVNQIIEWVEEKGSGFVKKAVDSGIWFEVLARQC